MADQSKLPLSLYLHFPFCVRKCRYCDFLSFPADEAARAAYLTRLQTEIREKADAYQNYEINTIFIGGGTPSLMTGSQMQALMDCVKSCFHVNPKAEITSECNPGTVDEAKLAAFRAAGINRISFGLQSMNAGELAYLGRIHTKEDFLRNYEAARRVGFTNINIDLMSALPGQTTDSYLETLKETLALEPEHISAYSLIIEEGTPFGDLYGSDDQEVLQYERPSSYIEEKGEILPLPDEDSERAMYHETQRLLLEKGYGRYEISNYAKAGAACKHNMTYWQRGDYLGLGLGAASMIGSHRFTNTTDLSVYMDRFDLSQDEWLSVNDQIEETMFLGLRCIEGVSTSAFAHRFGKTMEEVYGDVIRKYEAMGLLAYDQAKAHLALTEEGLDVANWILSDFLL